MSIRGIWEDTTPYLKLVIFVIMIFLFAFFFTALSGLLIYWFYDINILTNPTSLSNLSDPTVIAALKLMQVFSASGTFIIPPFIAAFLFSKEPINFLALKKSPAPVIALAVIGLVLFSSPLINQMMVWNQQMILPEFLKTFEVWMKNTEAKATEVTLAFMKMNSAIDFLLVFLMIALLPALGEELVFRGIIQQLFKKLIANSFLAILFTSIIFSAIHMQFYGFFPRMMLGLLLGYLLEWSGSLWLPILLHFLNNGAAVVMAYFFPDLNIDLVGTSPGEAWQVLVSAILCGILIYFIYAYSKKKSYQNPGNLF